MSAAAEKDVVATAATSPINYTKLDGAALITALGRDPKAWATAAGQHAGIVGGHITHGFLSDWFAKALDTTPKTEEQSAFARAVAELKQREEILRKLETDLADRENETNKLADTLKAEAAELGQKRAAFEEEVKAFEQFKADKAAETPAKPTKGKKDVIDGKGGSTDAPGNPEE